MFKIPYSKQFIDSEDIKSVVSVLKSKFITTGPKILKFEEKLTKYFDSKFAIAVNSATSALHLSCLALGLKKNDFVWTTPVSFVASANCAIYCGAKIDFVDIDNDTFNISTKSLENKLKKTPTSKLPKILIVVHLSGHPANMSDIKKLSRKYKFKIIEDSSHAVGSTYFGNKIGNCKYSDLCIFSFHPVKIITTGEGGAILTNSKNLNKKIELLRSHGLNRKVKSLSNPWKYDQVLLGYNYRMNELEAALGISQLKKLKKFFIYRNKIADFYKKNLNSNKIKIQKLIEGTQSSMHLFIIRVDKKKRYRVFKNLKNSGYVTNLHYMPIYKHSFYRKFKFLKKELKNSEKYYHEAISIPLFYGLKKTNQKQIINIINKTVS